MHAASHDQVTHLIASISDVAVGGDWTGVLHEMESVLNVCIASIEVIDKRAGTMRILSNDLIDPEAERLYEEHVHRVNPRFSLLPTTAVGEIRADRHIAPEVDAAAGEYYEWLKRTGCRYFAGHKLFDSSDFLALASIHVPEARDHIDAPTEELFTRLRPHLTNALCVQQALAPVADGIEALDNGALGSDRAYALIGTDGRILECSAEFERIVRRCPTLGIRGRRLTASGPDKASLDQFIDRATLEDGTGASPVRIRHAKGHHGLLMRAVRLSRGRELFARLRPVAMLVLIDLDGPAADISTELRSGWGLTPREAELAMLLGEGRRLDQAAALLGITEQTARHHLKAIFRRMEIDRQTDLVRLVTRLGA
jgi:DNA-binding CsgD family transcriptional regulator